VPGQTLRASGAPTREGLRLMPVAAGEQQGTGGDVRKMGEEGCVRVVGTGRQRVSSGEQTSRWNTECVKCRSVSVSAPSSKVR
jgi:hypothetical protein